MPSPTEIHQAMAEGYKEQLGQAYQDARRRPNHFQVRLPDDLAEQLRSYMASRNLNANQALNIIASKFFR